MSEDSVSNKLTYFLIGAGVGTIMALLFAPKAGRELREDIADVTRRGIDYTQENARILGEKTSELYTTGKDKASQLYETGKEKTNELLDTGRETVLDQRQRLAAAIDAGKRAYQEKKAEVLSSESALEATAGEKA